MYITNLKRERERDEYRGPLGPLGPMGPMGPLGPLVQCALERTQWFKGGPLVGPF